MFSLSPQQARLFLKELVAVQKSWAELLVKEEGLKLYSVRERLQQGHSLKDVIAFPEGGVFEDILTEIVEIIGYHQPKMLKRLEFIRSQGDKLYTFLLCYEKKGVKNLLDWAEENELPAALIGQIADWVLRPGKMAWGLVIQSYIDSEGWESNLCPVCGEPPDIALIGKEKGERSLGCCCCQVTWPYPRLKCPGCGTTKPENLKYYYLEEGPGQQIHYCQQCLTYVKTLDQHYNPEEIQDLLEASLLTAHLDVLAQDQGLRQL